MLLWESLPVLRLSVSSPTKPGSLWTRRESNPHLPTGQVDVLPLHPGPGMQGVGCTAVFRVPEKRIINVPKTSPATVATDETPRTVQNHHRA